jgi:glycosyltransferase involved in cell wall biosynthesis
VQVCNPPDVYWPLALVMRALGRPWVFDHHDLCPEIYATRAGESPNQLVFKTLVGFEWLTLRTASAVFATNESFRENALGRGVAPGKVSVVRNGPAADEIAAPAADRPVHTGRTPNHLVYLGVLGPQDNVEGAVLAADELTRLRGRTDWRLTIAGDGESMPALQKLVSERGLGDVVEFAGWLDAEGVDKLLQEATVAIQPDLPTRMNQLSTMAKTVEYLGRGVPVVAADLIETRRTAGDTAAYVPNGTPEEFGAAVNELFDDPERAARMRKDGLERFTELLSWERQEGPYIAVWDRLLAKRKQRAGVAVPQQATAPRVEQAPAPLENAE